MNLRPDHLKNEARDEAYEYFDKNIGALKKRTDGTIDGSAPGLVDNEVDAFRHAYVSGVFTQVYGEEAAEVFGRINEYSPLSWYSDARNPGSLNMDLWNNSVGRKYGKKSKDRKKLLRLIHEALKNGELIVNPEDGRRFKGRRSDPITERKHVVVLYQNENGRNVMFFDLAQNISLSREAFVAAIEAGYYPTYTVKLINGLPTPVSNPDQKETNNLG